MAPLVNTPQGFSDFARMMGNAVGTWQAFAIAVLAVAIWGLAGFYFGFSNELYQLIINTGTTIVTFLMVFLLQHTQNRDTLALQVKLDEIVKALPAARDEVAGAEELPEEELRRLRKTGAPTKERGVRRA